MACSNAPNRRQLLEAGVKAAVGAGLGPALGGIAGPAGAAEEKASRYREAALAAARWIRSCRVKAGAGTAWPADPARSGEVTPELYSGAAGVALFFLEAHHATGDAAFLSDARGAADYLLGWDPEAKNAALGLYTGAAGIAFALGETYRASGAAKYRDGERRLLEAIRHHVRDADGGVEWNTSSDIIAGGAGIGLELLHAGYQRREPAYRDLAARAGLRLVKQGIPEAGGLKWRMDPSFPRLMPNFSHGTAGVCYFLASLYQATKSPQPESARRRSSARRGSPDPAETPDRRSPSPSFLDTALAGARYLQAIADKENGVCRIFHHEPGGKDLYYLGWCHGPVGTARLFYRLYEATGDRAWMDWVQKCAQAVLESGVPERQTSGFWNNVSQCCGTAGVGDFFLSLHRVTGEKSYLRFSERCAAALLAQATRDGDAMKWIQAEHRVKPKEVAAQTGYMQGAAGIGTFFLRLDAFSRGRKPFITLPDSPY